MRRLSVLIFALALFTAPVSYELAHFQSVQIVEAADGQDDFERGSVSPLDGSWNNLSATVLQLVAGDVYSTDSSQDAFSFFTGFSPTANQEATVKITIFTGAGAIFLGPILRGQDASNLYVCFANRNIGGQTTQILVLNGGSFSAVASESSTTWAATDTLRCKVEGSSFNVYRNGSGSPLTGGTDNTFSTGGSVGMWITTDDIDDAGIEEFSATDVAVGTVHRSRPLLQ
jgi:hypothetical protein